jgi:hypothetical protein
MMEREAGPWSLVRNNPIQRLMSVFLVKDMIEGFAEF